MKIHRVQLKVIENGGECEVAEALANVERAAYAATLRRLVLLGHQVEKLGFRLSKGPNGETVVVQVGDGWSQMISMPHNHSGPSRGADSAANEGVTQRVSAKTLTPAVEITEEAKRAEAASAEPPFKSHLSMLARAAAESEDAFDFG